MTSVFYCLAALRYTVKRLVYDKRSGIVHAGGYIGRHVVAQFSCSRCIKRVTPLYGSHSGLAIGRE